MSENTTIRESNIRPGTYNYAEDINKGILGKHVSFLKKERVNLKNIAVKILGIAEGTLLSLSVVGIPVVYQAFKTSKKMDNYAKFQKAVNEADPPHKRSIEIKKCLQTFNHVNDYVIHNGFIWYRERNQIDQDWRPLYFEGFPNREPVNIQADGENLIVIDNHQYVHYKKVLKERLLIFKDEALKSGRPQSNTPIWQENETTRFILKDDFIWVQDKNEENAKWLPFYFEGWPSKRPIDLKIRENSLIITTDDEDATYDLNISPERLQDLLKGLHFPYTNQSYYSAIKKDEKDNWKDRWFSFPYFGLDKLNPHREKRLKIPRHALENGLLLSNIVAVSNRGGFNRYYENCLNGQHPPYSAVTGIYLYDILDNCIYLADPWLPRGFNKKSFPFIIPDKKIDVPQGMTVKKLCVSASVLLIFGTIDNQPVLVSRLEDFDTMGINPGLKYAEVEEVINLVDKSNIKPSLRILQDNYRNLTPEELWKPVSLNGLDPEDIDPDTFTIFQTGPGNHARQLHVESRNGSGFYEKSLLDDPWEYIPYPIF